MSDFFSRSGFQGSGAGADSRNVAPLKLSVRTLGHAIEEALMGGYTRFDLETVLADELNLVWPSEYSPSDPNFTKRSLIETYMGGWGVPQMAALARRIVTELDIDDVYLRDLTQLLTIYAGGGVAGSTKNLIFAA